MAFFFPPKKTKMVEAIFPSLKNQGAEEGMCFSDAFTISGRSMAFQPK